MRASRFVQALVVAGCLATASAASLAGERVYKWVDDKGTVHYGQQPPTATKTEAIEVKSGFSTSAEEQPSGATTPQQQPASAAEPDNETCERARRNLAALQSGGDLKRKDDYGQEHVMTDEEKAAEKTRAEAAIARACKAGATSATP